jgi:hypothetical protein
VWIADVADRGALVRLIRAALVRGVAPVDVRNTHLTSGLHTLQIRLRDKAVVVLSAELAGETATGAFALRLAPLDPSHVPELTAIAESEDEAVPISRGPMSASTSAIFDSEPPLPAAGGLPPLNRALTKTMQDPEPESVRDEELESVLFDPEAALISKAPPRPAATGADDTLTIPLRASMVPPGLAPDSGLAQSNAARSAPVPRAVSAPPPHASVVVPPAPAAPRFPSNRAPNDPLTISHLSIPSTTNVPSTERVEPADRSLSVEVDFDTSQSNPHTQRVDEWNADDGPAAADDSLAGSVVFDPDVMARETRNTNPPPAPPESLDVSVVFEDASLTPTAPHEIPPRRSAVPARLPRLPSSRRDPDLLVDEETETLPVSDRDPPSTQTAAAVSSGRGPRTQRRTGPLDVVVPGRVIANRYRIESLVGSGAVGAVYKAVHVDLPRTFAIKVLHPHFRTDQQLIASFRTEARAASLLDHPNVTVVHDFGEEPDGLVYIVMEFLQGTNLQSVLDEDERLEPKRAIGIMLQVCGALAAAHQRGIVHRDVKPDNIMLVPARDDEGRTYELVKVCDFGIAALESAPDAKRGEFTAGTPEYMAPEQASGRADARTDVYACGIVLYEMLTGRPPFLGETPALILKKHIHELARRPSELIPGLPPALEAVIMCAIEKVPDRRFRTIRDLRVELKRLV